MSRLVTDGKVFDAGKGWYSNIEKEFNLNTEPVENLLEILKKSFPLLDIACWNTEQINAFTHHLLGKHIIFVYVDADAVSSVHEVLLDNGYNSYANPGKQEIEKSFRLLENTVVIRPSITKQPKSDNGAAPIEKIIVDLLFENRKLNIISSIEIQQLLQNAVESGRINFSIMIAYAKRRKIDFIGQIKNIQIIKKSGHS